MNLSEFNKKWGTNPLLDDNYEEFINDAESVGNIVSYNCQINGCDFETMDLIKWKEHSREKEHYVALTSVVLLGSK